MKKTILKCFALGMAFLTTSLTSPLKAQNVQSATGGGGTMNVGIDGSNSGVPNTTTCTSLNADMMEIDNSAGGPACTFGANSGDLIAVSGYTGITNGSITSSSGITISGLISGMPISYELPIPYWNSGQAGDQVDYIDVAVGVTQTYGSPYPATGSNPHYFTLVTYESQGEIWLEIYYIYYNSGSAAWVTHPPKPFGLAVVTNNPIQISSAGGTAKRPHIELFHTKMTPASGKSYRAEDYVVVWEQGDPASPEVWAAEGPVAVFSGSIPALPANTFYVADGKQPDVVAVTASTATDPTDIGRAYVTYTSPGQDELHLSMWENGVYTPTYVTQLGSTLTAPDEYVYPRISGPMYYDFSDVAVVDDPVAIVSVAENDGGLNYGVSTYAHHDVNGTTNDVTLTDASNYSGYGFDRASYYSVMPSITGVGNIANSFNVGGYSDYPTAFYTDYTNNGSPYTSSGDFMAFGTDVLNTGTPAPILSSGTDYWEVENSAIPRSTPFSLTAGGDIPCIAIATANNSGADLFAVYFDGDDLLYRFVGTTNYGFKPTNVAEKATASYNVYPNPVSSALNITNADGAEYMITDIAGRVLASGTLAGEKATINTTKLIPGNYILQLSKDNNIDQVKFTKQ